MMVMAKTKKQHNGSSSESSILEAHDVEQLPELEQPDGDDTASASFDEDVASVDNTDEDGPDVVVFTFACSVTDDLPGPGCEQHERVHDGEAEDCCSFEFYDDRTVDSLILARRRLAKNRGEREESDGEVFSSNNKGSSLKMMMTRSCSGSDMSSVTVPLALVQTRERLVQFVQDSQRKRRVVQKHDSLELTRKRNPALIHHVWQEAGDDCDAVEATQAIAAPTSAHERGDLSLATSRQVNRLMRTADSLELTRERLPHLIHTRDLGPEEEDLGEDELSLPDYDHHWLNCRFDSDSDSEVDDDEWDSDFDPFEDDLDSILAGKTEEAIKSRRK
ncbi:MAG: hypothetical protein SGARI_000884 [Bacillariaceae sp.]